MSKLFDKLNFAGRRVLVTGGGKGIGRAVTTSFVQLGATVIVFDKDAELLNDLQNKNWSNSVQCVNVDLANWEATRAATLAVLPVHHLVNNAGIVELASFLNIKEQEINSLFEVNFKAALNVGQVVAQGMIDHKIVGGTIVNMSSVADSTGNKKHGVYGSTKAALTSLTKTMANELGSYGIRVNCVRPGLVNTELVSNLPIEMLTAVTDYFGPRSSLTGLIEPSEVANVVIFLSSPLSAMVTGAPLTIDAGFGTS